MQESNRSTEERWGECGESKDHTRGKLAKHLNVVCYFHQKLK